MNVAIHSEAMRVALDGRFLTVSFASPVRTCSWAIVGGGFFDAEHVAWLEVRDGELRPPVDAREHLLERLRIRGLRRVVGLLTSRRVSSYRESFADHGVRAHCVATVGLGNALRAGDPAGVAGTIGDPPKVGPVTWGTINLLVHVDAPLTDEALLEASAIATEAKTAAMLEAGVTSRVTGRPATGTGTDCTVVSAVIGRNGAKYAGKHTAVGAAVGEAVFGAISLGVADWLAENRR